MKGFATAAGASFFANLACLGLAVQMPAAAGWLVTGIASCLLGASLGFLHGFFLANPRIFPVALGAFGAALLLCVPVILVTYGFALVGAPLVLAYVLLVAGGTFTGVRARGWHAEV